MSFRAVSRGAVASAVFWLSGVGAAWAGGGGESLGATLPETLAAVCGLLKQSPCPTQFPTFSQFALEVAGLGNGPLEMIRTIGGAPDPAVNAANPPLPSGPLLSNPALTLQNLSPLAFIANQDQITPGRATPPASPVPLYATTDHFFADAFFYAATSQTSDQPDTLHLVYDDLSATAQNFTKGQNVAAISVPLAILNKDNTERPVMTTVQVVASCNGGTSCLTANAIGDFANSGNPQTKTAASIGINFTAAFGPSAVSNQHHLMFELQVPLLVTVNTDPAYFWETTNYPNHYPLSPIIGTVFSSNPSEQNCQDRQSGSSLPRRRYALPPPAQLTPLRPPVWCRSARGFRRTELASFPPSQHSMQLPWTAKRSSPCHSTPRA